MEQPQPGQSTKVKPKAYSMSKYPLYSNETPVFRALPNTPFIPCGRRNDYPDYLAYLYNNSGIHSAIVQGKSKYIYGKGFKIKENWTGDKVRLEALMANINGYQTVDELTKKKIFEKTLYGGAYYLIDWGAGVSKKPISISLQPYNTVRVNEDLSKFYVSKNWTREMSVKSRWRNVGSTKLPEGTIEYDAFDLKVRTGKQILFIKEDNPATDIYPLPEYEPAKTSIETDIECGFFHLNNVKSGFAAGTMVTFFNGAIAENDEEQRQLDRDFKDKFTGTDNAGEIIMNFQNSGTNPPVVSPLRSNELDKQYEQLSKDVINKTLQGHRVSNGLLFGIKTPGELGGGRSEFDLAWEHFCNTYVLPKQQEEEEDMNYLLTLYGFMGNPLELVVLDPIGMEITADLISKVVDTQSLKDLVYDKLGIAQPKVVADDDALSKINNVSPLVANEILSSLNDNEKRALVGLPPIAGGDVIKPRNAWENPIGTSVAPPMPIQQSKMFMKFQDDYILNKFMSIGEDANLFEVVKLGDKYDEFVDQSLEDKIVSELKKNKKIPLSKLVSILGITENELYKALDKLDAKNILSVKYIEKGGEVVVDVQDINEPKAIELYTKWQYVGPNDSHTRDFCRQLMNANKLYTRAEIENMQNEAHTEGFNESVWRYKGGWYHDPVIDINLPSCRHSWNQIIVRRKQQ